jgi:hypothetical protein
MERNCSGKLQDFVNSCPLLKTDSNTKFFMWYNSIFLQTLCKLLLNLFLNLVFNSCPLFISYCFDHLHQFIFDVFHLAFIVSTMLLQYTVSLHKLMLASVPPVWTEGETIKKVEWLVWLIAYCLTSRFYIHAAKMASKGQVCGWHMVT